MCALIGEIILICACVAIVVGVVITSAIRKKQGKTCCGDCSKCCSCSSKSSSQKKK